MLSKILSGGQTGADQAACRAAQAFSIPTGGSMPQGFLTDDGPRPEFAAQYGATETTARSDPAWIEQNVQNSDATLWFGETITSDAHAIVEACHRLRKPCLPIDPGASFQPEHVVGWITENTIETLNVAGNREIEEPGIGKRVEEFLSRVLQQLGHKRT
jgi:hypothetical protein